MIVFDQLRKNDPQLQLLTVVVLVGFLVLVTGLWWVQIVRAGEYQSHLEAQTYRTVRLPALRGKILDRNGRVLADNRATYNVCLYLEDLSGAFQDEFKRIRPMVIARNSGPFWKRWLGGDTRRRRRGCTPGGRGSPISAGRFN